MIGKRGESKSNYYFKVNTDHVLKNIAIIKGLFLISAVDY
jgi:hypothetical protein